LLERGSDRVRERFTGNLAAGGRCKNWLNCAQDKGEFTFFWGGAGRLVTCLGGQSTAGVVIPVFWMGKKREVGPFCKPYCLRLWKNWRGVKQNSHVKALWLYFLGGEENGHLHSHQIFKIRGGVNREAMSKFRGERLDKEHTQRVVDIKGKRQWTIPEEISEEESMGSSKQLYKQ